MPKKIIRITTVPMALAHLLRGQMRYMKNHGFEVILISADGPERNEVIATEECPHIIVPMTRKITPFRDLQCLFELYRIIRKEKPDIVHTHTPKAGLLGMLAAAFCGTHIRIHTVAGMPLMIERGFKFGLLKFIEKLTYKAASNVWPNSESLYKYILENEFTFPLKLKVIGKGSSNGIDITRFNPDLLDPIILDNIKEELNFNSSYYYLIFIGRLVADKGISELVHVFSKIHIKYPDLRLILVGSYEQELDPLPLDVLGEIENNPSIIHVNWTDKGAYYMKIANCLIFPSHREGFPNVVLQAGAMNLPVICSNIPGNVDIVKEGITGLLFNKGNEEMIYIKLEYALSNKDEMKRMAEILKNNVVTDFPQQKIWELIYNEYQSLIRLRENEIAE